jgi:general secretion pathway protein F
MAEFTYKALDAHGQFVTGQLQALSMSVAERQLVELGYLPLSSTPDLGPRQSVWEGLIPQRRVSRRDVTILLQDLALLLRSGLPLDEGMKLLAENASSAGYAAHRTASKGNRLRREFC